MANQRRTPRFKRRLNVRFRSESGRERSAFTGDVSRDGLFVTCTQPEAPGRLIEMDIEVPGMGEVRVMGVVAWVKRVPAQLQSVRRGGFGVQIRFSPEEWCSFLEQIEGGPVPGAVAAAGTLVTPR